MGLSGMIYTIKIRTCSKLVFSLFSENWFINMYQNTLVEIKANCMLSPIYDPGALWESEMVVFSLQIFSDVAQTTAPPPPSLRKN